MLECALNLSEGRRGDVVSRIAAVSGGALLDLHSDAGHNRSVLTLAGPDVVAAASEVTRAAVALLDLREHKGEHPRMGVVDVVPFAPIDGDDLADALVARTGFAAWVAGELEVPAFLYGPERSLPEIRRRAFLDLEPDLGPRSPHATAGATCVGARPPLVAYNLWLDTSDVSLAQTIAREIRSADVRALGLGIGGHAQVSCNLISPSRVGPDAVYDAVASRAEVARAELVGLLPAGALARISTGRWSQLDVGEERTIEARLARAGLYGS